MKRGDKNQDVGFWLSRRVDAAPWFALIGVVANGIAPEVGMPGHQHQFFVIGRGCQFTLQKSGYSYAYANDARHMYDNNHGSVSLTLSRA